MAEHAAATGVTLAVEYLNRFETYFLTCAADTVRFIKEVNHPNCRMMYDTFHSNIEEKNIREAIRTAVPYTVLVHISENDRSTPGHGNVRWQETFDTLREIGYDGWMVVEAFGLALPEILPATKIWRRMYHSEEQLARDALDVHEDRNGAAQIVPPVSVEPQGRITLAGNRRVLTCTSQHKPLHAVIHRIQHVAPPAAVEHHRPRVVQLARLAAVRAPATRPICRRA